MKHLHLLTLLITTSSMHAADPEQKLINFIKKAIAGELDNRSINIFEDHIRNRLNANDVNIIVRGQGLLHFAVSHKAVDVVEMLCNKGADINLCNIVDSTPLHYAASNGDSEIVTFLLTHGAHTNVRDFSNKTPAQLAIKNGHNETAKLIKDYEDLPEVKEPDNE